MTGVPTRIQRITHFGLAAACLSCTSVNPYAVPQVLPRGTVALGAVVPAYAYGTVKKSVNGAPRDVEDRESIATPLPLLAFARVGLGARWEAGVQTENQGVSAYAQRELSRGRWSSAVRVGGSPRPAVQNRGGNVLAQYLIGNDQGNVEPVASLGAGWFDTIPHRVEIEIIEPRPRGVVLLASVGVRARVSGTLAVQPEIGAYRGLSGRAEGITVGIAWVGWQ